VSSGPQPLASALLTRAGVRHGFGVRGAPAPRGLVRPVQVHGTRAARVEAPDARPGEADALVCARPGIPVGVATADCVPVLAASDDGLAVAAIHAGWRGLAAGVVESGVSALREAAVGPRTRVVAAVGPHIGPCCYEVDGPVVDALRPRFGASLDAALRATRPGHARLDLFALAAAALAGCGVGAGAMERVGGCTRCDPERFHSYRRDGARAGRLLHFAAARPSGEA